MRPARRPAMRRQLATHDRPQRRSARPLDEPRAPEGRRDSGPGEDVRHRPGLHLLGVALENARAETSRLDCCRVEERDGQTAAPERARHEEAGDRPDVAVVDRRQDTRASERRERGARPERAPADRFAAVIGEDARRGSPRDQAAERLPVPGAFPRPPDLRRQAPRHAPASAAGAALAEQPLEIAPARRGQRLEGESGRPGTSAGGHEGTHYPTVRGTIPPPGRPMTAPDDPTPDDATLDGATLDDLSPKRRGWLRAFARLVLALVGLLILILLGGGLWLRGALRGSLPILEGEWPLPGLSAPARVERDAHGVPVIRGATRADVARVTGWVHAQERFFQMDLQRRSAAGELAELVGSAVVDADRGVRVHRFRDVARRVVEAAPPEARALIEAYTDGVNAGLAALRQPPFEYLALRATPAPWRPEDCPLTILAMFL